MKYKLLSGYQQTFLDFYRILAALFVVIGHSFSFYGISIFRDEQYFVYLQNVGVVMFFLLSGFLSAYSLSKKNKNGNYTLYNFSTHKIKRIMMEYVPALSLIAVIDLVAIRCNGVKYGYFETYNIEQFIGNIFMFQGMAINRIIPNFEFVPFGSGRPLWTLALEWWLYFVFATIYLTIANKEKVGYGKFVLLGLFFTMPLEYFWGGRGNGLGLVFGLGVFSYYIYDLLDKKLAIIIFCFSQILYIFYGMVFRDAYTTYSFLILWILFFSGIKVFEKDERKNGQKIMRNKYISFISESTFMLYLLHYSVIDLICTADICDNVYFKFTFGIVTSIALSWGMYYIFGKKKLLFLIILLIKNSLLDKLYKEK